MKRRPRIPQSDRSSPISTTILGKSLAVGVGRPRLTNYGDVDRTIWVAVNDARSRGGEVRRRTQEGGGASA